MAYRLINRRVFHSFASFSLAVFMLALTSTACLSCEQAEWPVVAITYINIRRRWMWIDVMYKWLGKWTHRAQKNGLYSAISPPASSLAVTFARLKRLDIRVNVCAILRARHQAYIKSNTSVCRRLTMPICLQDIQTLAHSSTLQYTIVRLFYLKPNTKFAVLFWPRSA